VTSLVAAAALFTLVVGCSPFGEDTTVPPETSCTRPARPFAYQAWALSGEVEDVAVRCNTIYVAGDGTIGRRTGPLAAVSAGTGQSHGVMVELSGTVGEVDLPEALVRAIVDDGSGGWFVAGAFALAGNDRCPGVVHVTRAGRLDRGFCPRTNGPVDVIARHGDTLYLGGQFTDVGGRKRTKLAAVSTSAGRVLQWAPQLDPKLTCPDRDEPGVLVADVNALVATSTVVYIGGFFQGVGGTRQPGLVAVDTSVGSSLSFDAALDASDSCTGPSAQALQMTSDGLVVAVDAGLRLLDPLTGSPTGPKLPDFPATTLAANGSTLYAGGYDGAAAFDLESGRKLAWNPRVRGRVCCYLPDNGIFSILRVGPTIYLGGNFTSAGGASRKFVAAVDAQSGRALAWNPRPNGPILALGRSASRVVLGGTLTSVNVEPRFGLVALDGPTGRLLDWAPRAVGTRALEISGAMLYLGGNFKRVDGQPRRGLAAFDLGTKALDDWSPAVGEHIYGVTVLAASGERIYAGGDFTGAASALDAESLPRKGVSALDAESGEVLDWDPELDAEIGDVHVHVITTAGDVVYLGGEFDTAAGLDHRGAVALEGDAVPSSEWVPDPSDLGFVYALAAGPGGVYLGGWFSTAGGSGRSGVAEVSVLAGRATDFDAGEVGQVEALWLDGRRLFVAGEFTSIQGRPRAGFAALDAASGRVLPLDQSPNDRARSHPGTVVVAGGAAIVDGFIQGNGEQLVVMPLAR
jgi:hypothetical protein